MALTLALILAGPRAEVDDQVDGVEVPGDVAQWLADSEASIANLRPGEEKTLVWADSASPSKTPFSVVYLHGFSADRHEIDPVPQRVAEALGANLFLARFTGHGQDGAALGEATAEEWFRDAAEAVAVGRNLGEQVIVMGTSTGATLALWAAASLGFSDDFAATVLVSPNLHPADPNSRLLLLPWGGALARVFLGPERCFEPASEAEALHWTTCYPTRVLLPMMALVERVRTMDLSEMTVPTLVVYSTEDEVVDPVRTVRMFGRLGSETKALVPFDRSTDPQSHVLGGAIKSPESTDSLVSEILSFLRPIVGVDAGPP